MNPIHPALPKSINRQKRPEPLLAHRIARTDVAELRPEQTSCRIAVVGFGTVGSAVARLLQARGDRHPLRLTHVCNRHVARKKVGWAAPDVVWTDSMQQVLDSDADVVVELMGGLDPAYELVRGRYEVGKSVVTANKQLMAQFGSELLQAGQRRRAVSRLRRMCGRRGPGIVRACRMVLPETVWCRSAASSTAPATTS